MFWSNYHNGKWNQEVETLENKSIVLEQFLIRCFSLWQTEMNELGRNWNESNFFDQLDRLIISPGKHSHKVMLHMCLLCFKHRESRMWNITKMMVPIHTKWICRKNDFLSKFLKVWRCSCRLMHNPFKKETMLIVSYFPFAHRYLTLKRIMHRSVRSFNIPLPRVTYRHSTSLYRETLVLYCEI